MSAHLAALLVTLRRHAHDVLRLDGQVLADLGDREDDLLHGAVLPHDLPEPARQVCTELRAGRQVLITAQRALMSRNGQQGTTIRPHKARLNRTKQQHKRPSDAVLLENNSHPCATYLNLRGVLGVVLERLRTLTSICAVCLA